MNCPRIPSALLATALLWLATGACERKAIPPRDASPPPAPAAPETLLEGGTEVFRDTFERAELGPDWRADHKDWHLEGGWLRSSAVDNAGVWLLRELPDHARVEFDAKSMPLPGGKPFPGDIKAEVFATEPAHQAGYVVINGGWSNKLDVIARLDEHGGDRKERPAAQVVPDKVYHWAIARRDGTLYWFRDGVLQMSYPDPSPIAGHYFGFNNWRTNVAYDNLAVYRLD
ncbi:MAG: hypothetical protein H6744_20290 [Deltaproteobacteria bacterium]|nr:hypothetical protein [Deltaproteobacteria bacterium]